ncbi:MAG: KamA family radical SAM protein [Deltaproteobacteria bacterium]|nr:KamA family radical SAM protein [Deltaproteobacteria bacterium]
MDRSNAASSGSEDAEPPLEPPAEDAEPPSCCDEKSSALLNFPTLPAWQLQLQEAHTSRRSLEDVLEPNDERLECFDEVSERYPVRVPPYYLSLINPDDPDDPIARMSLPDFRELSPCPSLSRDPLEEESDMPVERLVHRYGDRALVLATSTCAMYCRFCTRKRLAGREGGKISPRNLEAVVGYLRAHPEVRDVIVSGGDPLTLSDAQLAQILSALRAVPSIEILRVGTRMPAVLPQRITPALVRTLARFQPLFLNTHFNHPRELTPEAMEACARLADGGIPLGNQTVLLAGVNDRPEILAELFRKLLRARVRPYYLFQCDLTEGVEHLRTPLSRGIEIMEALRGRLSGLAIPTYVVDAPHGGGKIPVCPNYVVSFGPGRTVLRNFAGQMVAYPDPVPGVVRQDGGGNVHDGVSALLSGALDLLGPRPEAQETRRRTNVSRTAAVSINRPLTVGLAFNVKHTESLVDDREAHFESPRTIDAIETAIKDFGHNVVRLEADTSFPSRLAEARVDIVFNVAEGFHGRSREAHVPAVCEMLGVEYTGSDPLTLAACLDKSVTKRLLREAGVPTPSFFLVNGSPMKVPPGFSFPAIVKPNAECSSKGIGSDSVAHCDRELSEIVARLRGRYGRHIPLIVEGYIEGREITVGLLSRMGRLVPLEPMEVVFLHDSEPHIYGFDLKQNWDGRLEYQCPARLDEKLLRACRVVAAQASRTLGCRDLARVDLRLDQQGVPWVIEVNALPGLTPSYSDLVMASEASGISYRDLVGRIVECAVTRMASRRKKVHALA